MGLPLVLEDLTWSFLPKTDPFLHLPSMTIPEGRLVVVTGPSGAGKSTLLFLLAGLELPTAGRLLWGGYDPAADKTGRRDAWRRRNLGLVFQDFQLVPELTALENVLLPITFGSFSVAPAEKNRAFLLLEQMGVGRPHARAATLSRGEMQRTALARALLGRPPVLLADEPTASLDAVSEKAVAELLAAYCRDSGATLVVSTHQAALREKADQHLCLEHGTLTGDES